MFLSPENLEFSVPNDVKFIRIDVGLSNDASHTVDCLLNNNDRMVVGIEPHPENIKGLYFGVPKFYSVSLRDCFIRKGYIFKEIPDLQKKFVVIKGAAGSSESIVKRNFFSAYPDKGNSSFYNIQSIKTTGNIVDREFEVTEFPLSLLFKEIKKAGFNFVESLKIDTEGNELEVLKGASDHLRRVLYCRVECFKGIYANTKFVDPKTQPTHIILGKGGYHDSATAVIEYLKQYNFKLISSSPGDYTFINLSLSKLLTENEIYP
jgi:FkbM family methyltransferase